MVPIKPGFWKGGGSNTEKLTVMFKNQNPNTLIQGPNQILNMLGTKAGITTLYY